MDDPQSGADTAAARLLRRRPLFEGELRRKLLEAGHSEETVSRAIERLRDAGQVDDGKLARHLLMVRASRAGHGRARLEGELTRRGVTAAVARAAWDRLVADGDLNPDGLLDREVRKRLAREKTPIPERRKPHVYNALVRAGFEPEAVEAALRAHGVRLETPDESCDEGTNDDIG